MFPQEVEVQPCTQTDRIGRIEDSVKEISNQTKDIAHSVEILVLKMEPIIEKVNQHERALRGSNGDVGMVAKVSGMTEVVNDLHLMIKGRGEDTGMAGDVSDIGKTVKAWADNQKWLFRLIVGWLIITALGAFLYVITVMP